MDKDIVLEVYSKKFKSQRETLLRNAIKDGTINLSGAQTVDNYFEINSNLGNIFHIIVLDGNPIGFIEMCEKSTDCFIQTEYLIEEMKNKFKYLNESLKNKTLKVFSKGNDSLFNSIKNTVGYFSNHMEVMLIYINKNYRDRKYGFCAVEKIKDLYGNKSLMARIKVGNEESKRLFEKSGFILYEDDFSENYRLLQNLDVYQFVR